MNHQERYRRAWGLYTDPSLSSAAKKTLENEMDSAQNEFEYDEFQTFMQTLPGFVEHWLKISAPVHQRARCLAHGVRSHAEIDCRCRRHWNAARQWCNNCGRTRREIVEGLHDEAYAAGLLAGEGWFLANMESLPNDGPEAPDPPSEYEHVEQDWLEGFSVGEEQARRSYFEE